MQFRDFMQVLNRRWYLVIVVLLCAIGATLATVSFVGPTYRAQGIALLFPPDVSFRQAKGTNASSNPYLTLDGLNQPRDIVIRSINAQSTYLDICRATGDAKYEAMRQELCGAHPSVTYEVTPDFNSNAPVILVTVEAGTRESAVTALEVVMNRIPTTLTALQRGLNLRPKTDITSRQIQADAIPEIVRKDQIRAGVLASGGVAALGLLLIGLLDGWLTTLTRRRFAARSLVVPDWSLGPSEEHADGQDGSQPPVVKTDKPDPGADDRPGSPADAPLVSRVS